MPATSAFSLKCEPIREFSLRYAGKPRTLAELGIVGVKEVSELTPDDVLDGIEEALAR